MYAGAILVLAAIVVLAYTFLFNTSTPAPEPTASDISVQPAQEAPASAKQAPVQQHIVPNGTDQTVGNATPAVAAKPSAPNASEQTTALPAAAVPAPKAAKQPAPAKQPAKTNEKSTTGMMQPPADAPTGPVFFQIYIDTPQGGDHAAQ